jgi:citronellol/citronellal dehydrogenase
MTNETVSLKGKTVFITGASRGIGKAIALKAAKEGANIVIVAKTITNNPRLPGTIYTAAEEVEKAGGRALAICCDIRSEAEIEAAIKQAVEKFGGIDIVINNASAISLTPTLATSMKKFDLMHSVNVRGTFAVSKAALPFLKRSKNPHILMLSPPLFMTPKWFGPNLAYTMSKYGMSMCVLGLAEEWREAGIAVNALWPKTVIDTAALQAISSDSKEMGRKGRIPEIMADAAFVILTQPSKSYT